MPAPVQFPVDISEVLRASNDGDEDTINRILPLVYDELRRQAHHFLRLERPGHTLQTTALIHEAYIKLIEQRNVGWENRSHFFAISARMMRHILVDYARTKHRRKRGGHAEHIPLEEAVLPGRDMQRVDMLALDEALERLAEIDPQQARIVEMRYFAGMSVAEIAEVLEVSKSTVSRDWNVARAWLRFELTG